MSERTLTASEQTAEKVLSRLRAMGIAPRMPYNKIVKSDIKCGVSCFASGDRHNPSHFDEKRERAITFIWGTRAADLYRIVITLYRKECYPTERERPAVKDSSAEMGAHRRWKINKISIAGNGYGTAIFESSDMEEFFSVMSDDRIF